MLKIHDEWEGLANMLANLIAKYATELTEQENPDPSCEEEQNIAA